MEYYTNCVIISKDELLLLESAIDLAVEITSKKFLTQINTWQRGEFKSLLEDPYTEFYESRWNNQACVYFVHSAIEYIFV